MAVARELPIVLVAAALELLIVLVAAELELPIVLVAAGIRSAIDKFPKLPVPRVTTHSVALRVG